jgi:gamma-glutamyl-gamma-aminobutyrate hydrolase PuuD
MRIGVTLRVDTVAHYCEVRDGLDHQWISFLERVKVQVVLIPNQLKNPEAYYHDLSLQGLLLTGGNDPGSLENPVNISVERDQTEAALFNAARSSKHPVIGVCRGMQFMCLQTGEQLQKIENHVAKRHPILSKNGFGYPQNWEVNSFHNWALIQLRKESMWQKQALSPDGCIEAIKHKSENIHGIMWHPEREPNFSSHDINFFKTIFSND